MLRTLASCVLISTLAWAGDGRPPRASGADYPVHQDIKAATIAAVRVTADQWNRTFPSDLAKKYIVVEVAIYPKDGASFEAEAKDFSLRFNEGGEAHPDTAEDVAWMRRPRNTPRPDSNGPHVTGEAGIIVASGQDPTTGRRVNSVGTYEGVGVNNYPTQPPPPSGNSRADADRMQAKLDDWALPEGRTTQPVAGYLYFPAPSKKTKGALRLQFERGDSTATLTLPAK